MYADLLPCPFCGNSATLHEHPAHSHAFARFMPDHQGSWTIECDHCGCGHIAETEMEVRRLWDRRPSPAPAPDSCGVVIYFPTSAEADVFLESMGNAK